MPLEASLKTKITAALVTRFSTTPAAVRIALPDVVEEHGKVRILNDGDTIRAAALDSRPEDGRDASFIRVCFPAAQTQ